MTDLRMIDLQSIRVRLTLWYAGMFALFALAFGLAGYGFVARATGARVDEALRETAADVARSLRGELARGAGERSAILAVMREFRLGDAAVAALDVRTATAVIAYELEPPPPMRDIRGAAPVALLPADFRALLGAAPPAAPAFVTARTAAGPVRVFTLPYRLGRRELVLGAAQSLLAQERTLREARLALAVGTPLMLLLAAGGGYALARKSLSPVTTMAEQAAHIGARTLHERLPVRNPRDELGRLAAVFNGLLARLENAFARQRRFMADASHELRTPLAIVGGEAELALARDDRSAAELRAALATVGEESLRMRRIVDDLFLLARADAGEQPIARDELYLADLCADAVRAVRTLAERREVTLALQAEDDLPFRGDEGLLRRLLLNLLDNAIKYTPPGGRVTVTAERRADVYTITVADTGPGVPAAARERIFDRFYRAEREARGGGAGLGLAIARWIAEAHGGRLALTRSDAGGSTFTATLPVRDADLAASGTHDDR